MLANTRTRVWVFSGFALVAAIIIAVSITTGVFTKSSSRPDLDISFTGQRNSASQRPEVAGPVVAPVTFYSIDKLSGVPAADLAPALAESYQEVMQGEDLAPTLVESSAIQRARLLDLMPTLVQKSMEKSRLPDLEPTLVDQAGSDQEAPMSSPSSASYDRLPDLAPTLVQSDEEVVRREDLAPTLVEQHTGDQERLPDLEPTLP